MVNQKTYKLVEGKYNLNDFTHFSLLLHNERQGNDLYVTDIKPIADLALQERFEYNANLPDIGSKFPTMVCIAVVKEYIARNHDTDKEFIELVFTQQDEFMKLANHLCTQDLKYADNEQFRIATTILEDKLK